MKYLALLRGINVGGKNMIKMETLREKLAEAGFENVKSYINSGNLIFETKKTADRKVAEKVEAVIKKEFGFDIRTVVRTIPEIEEIIKNNPFEGQFDDDKNVHVLFLEQELTETQHEQLMAAETDAEKFAVHGANIIVMLKIHVLDSLIGKDFVGKKLKVSATGRNWRTVKKLAEY